MTAFVHYKNDLRRKKISPLIFFACVYLSFCSLTICPSIYIYLLLQDFQPSSFSCLFIVLVCFLITPYLFSSQWSSHGCAHGPTEQLCHWDPVEPAAHQPQKWPHSWIQNIPSTSGLDHGGNHNCQKPHGDGVHCWRAHGSHVLLLQCFSLHCSRRTSQWVFHSSYIWSKYVQLKKRSIDFL